MSRLIDQAYEHGIYYEFADDAAIDLIERIPFAEVFVVDDVVDRASTDSDYASTISSEKLAVVPPYDLCWFEFKTPLTAVESELGEAAVCDAMASGMIPSGVAVGVSSTDIREYRADVHSDGTLVDPEIYGWVVTAIVMMQFRTLKPLKAIQYLSLFLDTDGLVKIGPNGGYFGSTDLSSPSGGNGQVTPDDVTRDIALRPCLMSWALLNCKNVGHETVTPPEKLSRKHLKKHGSPLHSYKVLTINGLDDKPKPGTGKGRSGGLREHLRRGHFKHFSENKPLFGKYTGTYWWQQAVRGNPKLGTVEKDYEIKAGSV